MQTTRCETCRLKLNTLCFEINTIGAIGDVWIVLKLLPARRGSLVQDTMTGVEIWRLPDGA